MTKARTVYVTCPFCKGTLEVNTENGKVVRHFEAKEKPESGDTLSEAVRALKDRPAMQEAKFRAAREMEKHKIDRLESAFREKKKAIEESGETGKPLRPIDLD
jgi:uncharacterized Zn finger protein (UPF0148 family)